MATEFESDEEDAEDQANDEKSWDVSPGPHQVLQCKGISVG